MLSSTGSSEQPVGVRSEPGNAVALRQVCKRFRRYTNKNTTLKLRVLGLLHGRPDEYVEFDALKDVSLDIPKGQMVAVIGANGAGKSTLLKVMAQLLRPDSGQVRVEGHLSPLLDLGTGLSHELSGRRNVYLYGALLGLKRSQIEERFSSIVEFSGLIEFIDTPLKHYSTGMLMRLAFAVAAHMDPDVLLVDEVLAVGDAAYQVKCVRAMEQFREQGKTIVLVTHTLPRFVDMCDRAILLDRGQVLEEGTPASVLAAYERLFA